MGSSRVSDHHRCRALPAGFDTPPCPFQALVDLGPQGSPDPLGWAGSASTLLSFANVGVDEKWNRDMITSVPKI